eukprot:1152626-Pelagomonas_calceolata.AAC.5
MGQQVDAPAHCGMLVPFVKAPKKITHLVNGQQCTTHVGDGIGDEEGGDLLVALLHQVGHSCKCINGIGGERVMAQGMKG